MNSEIISALLDAFPLLIPECILIGTACLLFLGATFKTDRHLWGLTSLMALCLAGVALYFTPAVSAAHETRADIFASPVRLDGVAWFIKAISIVGGIVLVLMTWDDVPDRFSGEFHACLLILIAGLCLTGSANELIVMFLALELVSIPTYVMLYLPRADQPAQEAAMKYFLLSVFSSGLLLFGFSYLYGLTGTTNIPAMLDALLRAKDGLPLAAQLALVMTVAGLSFRIAAVPFHFYAPDVYQGTATSMAGLLAFVPKVAGFAAMIRVLGFVFPEGVLANVRPGQALGSQVPMLLWILAAVSMSLGNVLALLQDNLKRLLAYSSVAHAGYMLIGLAVAPQLGGDSTNPTTGGVDAVLFYLASYGAMTLGVFGVIVLLSTPERPVETVDDLAGLSRSHPGIALVMALFLFSLIGIPLTGGFWGKFLLFWGAMKVAMDATDPATMDQARLFQWLALIGALNAAVAAWYYLRMVAVMYLRNPLRPLAKTRQWAGLATIGICAIVTLVLGVYPPLLLRLTKQASQPAGVTARR